MTGAHSPREGRRVVLGNALVLLVLAVVAWALARWNAGDWWTAMPRTPRWVGAGVSLVIYLGACGWWLQRAGRRARATTTRSSAGTDPDTIWVVHASQTGFAMEIAGMSADALKTLGMSVQRTDLGHLTMEQLAGARRVLFVVSTTGEGDPPDLAMVFVRKVMRQSPALDPLRYAVLALGDRQYDEFCAFGHQLDDWLRRNGARPLFDLVEVDNADQSALRHWQHHLGHLAGRGDLPDWSVPHYDRWRLSARRELNPGSAGGPAFHIELTPPAGQVAAWMPGDIAEVGPRLAPAAVASFLQALHLSPDAQVEKQGERERLADVVAGSQLPDVAPLTGRSAQEIADLLQPLPHREYSIASLPQDGSLQLLVRRMARPDGSAGLGSGWLCEHANPGDAIALRIRSNPNFHPPSATSPLVLIGNGTGMAGLRAHLKARVLAGASRNWLLFGERNADHDFLYREEITAWRSAGFIARLDMVFSRDQPARRYVQHVLYEQADELRRWVQEGAALYVCGSLEGMAPGVDAGLRSILGEDEVEQLLAQGRYRRDVY